MANIDVACLHATKFNAWIAKGDPPCRSCAAAMEIGSLQRAGFHGSGTNRVFFFKVAAPTAFFFLKVAVPTAFFFHGSGTNRFFFFKVAVPTAFFFLKVAVPTAFFFHGSGTNRFFFSR